MSLVRHGNSKIDTNILKLYRYSLQVQNKLVESTRKTE